MSTPRTVLALRPHVAALLLVLGGLVGSCGDAAADRGPNVVLITLDTTRADRFGCYGYELDTTPRMDELARQGTLFQRCVASSSLTPVSHASILTGLEPYQHGLRVLHAASGYRLPESVPSLASVLARRGWRTAAVLSAFPVSEHFALDRGFEHFDNGMSPELEGRGPISPDARQHPRQRRSDATTDAAIEWLDAGQRPFFLWLHYWDPHDQILLPPFAEAAAFRDEAVGAGGRAPDLYDTELRFMDAQIGRLLDALAQRGLDGDTLVVLTADHGQGLGEHDWPDHRLLYEEQIHVPLVVRLPAGPAGRVVPDLVRTTDIYPTVLDVLGLEPPGPVAGRSLLPFVRGDAEERRLGYAESLIKWDTRARAVRERRPEDDDLLHCLTDGRMKLIYRPLRPEASELYDLEVDPDEARNLYATGHPAERALLEALERLQPFALEPLGTAEIDPEAAQALRALGYAGDDG